MGYQGRYHPTENIEFFLTHHCNNHCGHCLIGKRQKGFLKAGQVKHFMGEAKKFGIPKTHILGGEPYLVPELTHSALRYAMEQGMDIILFSNAVFAKDAPSAKKEYRYLENLAIETAYRKPFLVDLASDRIHNEEEWGGVVPRDYAVNAMEAYIRGGFKYLNVQVDAAEGFEHFKELESSLKKRGLTSQEISSIHKSAHPFIPVGNGRFMPGVDRSDAETFEANANKHSSKKIIIFPMKDKREGIVPHACMNIFQMGTKDSVPCVSHGKLLELPEIIHTLDKKTAPTRIGNYLSQASMRRTIASRDRRV